MNVRSLIVLALTLAASSVAVAQEKPVTDKEIASTVNSHMSDLKSCLSSDYGVAGGKLRVTIQIEKDGHVSSASVNKSSENHKIDACIAKQIQKMQFPKPRNGQMWLSSYPITFTQPKIKVGTLTEDQIQAAIKPKMADITTCYDEAAKKKPDLAGQLELGIAVAASGTVAEVETLNSSTGNPEMDLCVVRKVKGVVFPKPAGDGEASFKYPFKFGPAAPADKKTDK